MTLEEALTVIRRVDLALRANESLAQHRLERVGTAFDTTERFGDG